MLSLIYSIEIESIKAFFDLVICFSSLPLGGGVCTKQGIEHFGRLQIPMKTVASYMDSYYIYMKFSMAFNHMYIFPIWTLSHEGLSVYDRSSRIVCVHELQHLVYALIAPNRSALRQSTTQRRHHRWYSKPYLSHMYPS